MSTSCGISNCETHALVFCKGPLNVAPCRTLGCCWGHEGCVGFSDCPCIRCRNDRYNATMALILAVAREDDES